MHKKKIKQLLLFTLLLAAHLTSNSQTLKQCQGESIQNWSGCIGTYTYPNGNIYTGEYLNGQRSGNGMIRILAKGRTTNTYISSEVPSTYVGEFRNDKINGHGIWKTDNGQRFVGDFVDNLMVKQY